MTGPKTSLKILTFFIIVYDHHPNVTSPHILSGQYKIYNLARLDINFLRARVFTHPCDDQGSTVDNPS